MFRTLVKTEGFAVEDQTYRSATSSFGRSAARGATARRSCSAPAIASFVDDDTMTNLEAKTACLVPASVYSRMLAQGDRRLTNDSPSRLRRVARRRGRRRASHIELVKWEWGTP